ncbi:MAG TPA: FAD binding domain-containing protein [Candidatus Dormibacteraeota bacterium]|nr:FAD binding domain-containing protein [Candidatus Dormibacteraeota bacterium]
MEFLQPSTWTEALQMKAANPDAMPIAGGTDVMVEINLDRHRPSAIIDLTRVRELNEWAPEGSLLRIGAGVTYARIIGELGDRLTGLAMASRTVGSPQIRNRGTVGGNLGSASPAGDAHPVLLATDAVVELASTAGTRRLPAREFFTGPKRNAMRKDELIAAFLVAPANGPQQFSKVGTRNAMVIAVCSFGLALDPERRHVGTGIGSAAPTPVTADEAERYLEGVLDERGLWDRPAEVEASAVAHFGELVAAAAKPIDDVRGTAAYRRHALAVMARRSFGWAWDEYLAKATA